MNTGKRFEQIDYFKEKGIEIEVIKKRVNNGFNVKKLLLDIKK